MNEKVIAIAENGVPVTEEMVEKWCSAYESGELPEGYMLDSEPTVGRPQLCDGGMESITIRIPVAQKKALQREAKNSGMNLSGYVRRILALRTL